MIVKPCLLIQLVTECVTPGRAICGGPCTNFYSGGCHLWWIATDGNVTLVVVTGQVSGGLSDQVRLTRGQVWDDEACTLQASKHPRRDARNAPLCCKGAKR